MSGFDPTLTLSVASLAAAQRGLSMTRLSLVLTAIGGTVIPQAAVAEQWVQVGETTLVRMFVDTDSAERSDARVRYRDKIVYKGTHQIGLYGMSTRDEPGRRVTFKEMHVYHDMDCANRTSRTLSVRYFGVDGELVSHMTERLMTERSTEERIAPRSLSDLGTRLLCPAVP
jgi:hypothetical protein